MKFHIEQIGSCQRILHLCGCTTARFPLRNNFAIERKYLCQETFRIILYANYDNSFLLWPVDQYHCRNVGHCRQEFGSIIILLKLCIIYNIHIAIRCSIYGEIKKLTNHNACKTCIIYRPRRSCTMQFVLRSCLRFNIRSYTIYVNTRVMVLLLLY